MIRISVSDLQRAADFGAVRREPSETDGEKSWSRLDVLSYAGDGFLTFLATDNRLLIQARFAVGGGAEPWSIAVASRRFRAVVTHLGGTAFEIGPGSPRTLRIAKGRECYNLPRTETEGVFPTPPGLAAGEPAARVCARQLLKVARFLAKGCGPEDLKNKGKTATLFGDGRAMGWARGTDLVAGGPALPFNMDVRTPDLARIIQWVRLVQQASGQPDPIIEIHKAVETLGRWYYRLRNEEGTLALYLPTSKSAFPREGIERALHAPTSYVIGAARKRLAALPRYVSANSRAGRSVLDLRPTEAGGGLLTVREKAAEAASEDVVQVACIEPSRPPVADNIFEVGARTLWEALMRFPGQRIRLAYRPSVRCLTIGPDVAEEAGLSAHPQVLLRTAGGAPSEAAG